MKELLEEAKKRYPVGTAFICIQFKDIRVVEDTSYGDSHQDETCIWFKTADSHYSGKVWNRGEWAEIVSKPEKEVKYVTCIDTNDDVFKFNKRYKILGTAKDPADKNRIFYVLQNEYGKTGSYPLNGCLWQFELEDTFKEEKSMEIAGFNVKFEEGKVSIGCYKDITLKDLKTMKKAIKVASKFGKDLTITEDSVIDNTEDIAIFLDEIEQLIERLDG